MVKKETGKKDDKKQAKDSFDPLLVESSQAATVVLMLDSTEEDIIIKASEAIYKFAEKCDANKVLLLQLDIIPRVLKLIASETHLVHRNACLVLGSMSKYPAVTRILKQFCVIPTLLKLLAPEEDILVQEYAALTLSSLAASYSCRRALCENRGLEPLIRCLGSQDANLQKNSIDAVTLLLEDPEAKKMLHEMNGIVPLVELLKSEYAEIQSQALVALRLIAEDVSCRQPMRDAGTVIELVNIINNQNLTDLHCLSVFVLANLFEDIDTLMSMRDNGTLKQLIAVVSDQPPIAEEKKPTKVKDKVKTKSPGKAKKGGKASAADDSSESDEEYDDFVEEPSKVVSTAVAFIPLSCEVKEQVAIAFQHAARHVDARKLLTEQELEKMLILLLNLPHSQVQIAASQAIRAMAESLVSRDAIGKLGGICPLVKMLSVEPCDLPASAVSALSVLTTFNEFNCHEVSTSGGICPLIALLASEQEVVIDHVLTVLTNMAAEDQLRTEITRSDVIPALICLLSSESAVIQRKVTVALCVFVTEACHRQQFVSCDGVHPLVDLLSSCCKEVRQNATLLISSLAADEMTSAVMCHQGALDILRYMQTTNEKNLYVDTAIDNLLCNNLSAKYAITGCLSATDIIADGFYDIGRLKLGKPFMPLTCYCNEPVNTKRPVIYVNTQCPSEGDASHVDERLLELIELFTQILVPLQFSSDAERAVALAQFVAYQMGGPIEKGNFSNFSWELHISKLKHEHCCNVIPIGNISSGIHYHRALLFKVIGDRTGIASSLVRGDFNHAWNELCLSDECEYAAVRYPPKSYIIDLIYEPGRLMRTDSPDAVTYQQQ